MENGKSIFNAILGGTVFLLVIFFVGRYYGRNTPPAEIPVPDDDPTKPTPSGQSSFDPKPLTDKLYNDIEGISGIFNRDMDAWNSLAALSDTDFVKVLNDWNARYWTKHKENLYDAYRGEYFNPITSKNLLSTLSQRFERLGKLASK